MKITSTIKMGPKPQVTDLCGEKVMVDFNKGKYFMLKGVGNDIWDLLEDLSSRLITGHTAIIAVQQFLKNKTEEQKQIYLNIIDKDLKCGLSEVTINKVCGNIIKTYDVALADKFNFSKAFFNKALDFSSSLQNLLIIDEVNSEFEKIE